MGFVERATLDRDSGLHRSHKAPSTELYPWSCDRKRIECSNASVNIFAKAKNLGRKREWGSVDALRRHCDDSIK